MHDVMTETNVKSEQKVKQQTAGLTMVRSSLT